MAINTWPQAERPREKLLQRGPQALSDAELLAILLRTGVRGKTAVDLARELLSKFDGLRGLFAAEQTRLCAASGLGPAKYTQLQAALESMKKFHIGGLEVNYSPTDHTGLQFADLSIISDGRFKR